jgi:hypothetical protein
MTLAEAKKERTRLQGVLRDSKASLEAVSHARKRAVAMIKRLEEGKPTPGKKELAKALRVDAKAFSRRASTIRARRKKQETALQRVRKAIARLSHRGKVTMFDDVTVSLIPREKKYAAAGYVNGIFTTWPDIQAGPWFRKLSIAVTADHDAECLDCEPGDASPDQVPAWVKRQHGKPVIYCSVSQAATVLGALARAGIARSDIRLWTAHYDGHEHICTPACGFGMPTTADATQWTDHALGRSLDQSLCSGSFFR